MSLLKYYDDGEWKPVGQQDIETLNGYYASDTYQGSTIPVLDTQGKLPISILDGHEQVLTFTVTNYSSGRVVKYSDGTMIFTSVKQSAVTTNETAGSVYASTTINFTYPEPFIEEPNVSIAVHWASGRPWLGLIENRDGTNCGYRIMGTSSSTQGRAMITAIGRWK